MEVDG
jgi:bifunctional non-homologous end joining protein LigD